MTKLDEHFTGVLEMSYKGLQIDKPEVFDTVFHENMQKVLTELTYDFDVVQPLGLNTPLARTMVKRVLLGAEGMTYRYLGVRMFSIPFGKELKMCNTCLTKRTRELMNSEKGEEYNVVLVNQCLPPSEEVKLKFEPTFKDQKVPQSISWHADSMLKHFSSIACYHWQPKEDEGDEPWRIGLRVEPHSEGPTKNQKGFGSSEAADGGVAKGEKKAPPVCVELPNGGVYYLLGEMNHHHQHAVFAGSGLRYSSTHRVGREGHSFAFIRNKVVKVLNAKADSVKTVRNLLVTYRELEFEWLRQWYFQGAAHRDNHTWWHKPMDELLSLWYKLGQRVQGILKRLESQEGRKGGAFDSAFHAEVEAGLEQAQKMREGWTHREHDPLISRLDEEHKPLAFPAVPTNEKEAIAKVAKWKEAIVTNFS